MDSTVIVSLVSVIASSIVSVFSIWKTVKAQRDTEKIKHEYEITLEKVRNYHEDDKDLRSKQSEILSEMAPYVFEMSERNYSHRSELYGLAVKLAACSDRGSPIGGSVNRILQALTTNYENRDKISWLILIESCAQAVNYQEIEWLKNSHKSPPQTARKRRTVQLLAATRSGFRAFRDNLKSTDKQ